MQVQPLQSQLEDKSYNQLTQSIWMGTTGVILPAHLEESATADVCVVGAGISGLTTAYLLTKAGRSVVVLDQHGIGGGETGRTTAHLTHVLDKRQFEMETIHGEDASRLAVQSHSKAIDFIEQIVADEEIECEFERLDGYLLGPLEILEPELKAVRASGLTGAVLTQGSPLPSLNPGYSLRFPNQAQFHPLKFATGLYQAILRLGGRVYGGSRVAQIESGDPAKVVTAQGLSVKARAVVVATNTPSMTS